jgi:hypothetical protein
MGPAIRHMAIYFPLNRNMTNFLHEKGMLLADCEPVGLLLEF